MKSFEFIHFILFLGIGQGFFLAIVIQFINNKNKLANRTLSLILIIASIMLLGRYFFSIGYKNMVFFRIALFVDILIFVFGPLLYLYFRRLIFNESATYRLHLSNFIPAFGMLVYHLWTYQYSYEEFIVLENQGSLYIPFLMIETVGIVFNFYSCYRCFNLLLAYQKEEKKNLSYSHGHISFLKTIMVVVILFLTLWVFSYISYYFLESSSLIISYNSVWIAISIFIYVIGFYSLKQSDFFRMPISENKGYKNKERLDKKVLKELEEGLEKLMTEEKIYLNHKLTLVAIAQKLNTTTNNVSWLLNNIHKSTFYDYINQYRVKEFVKKIQDGEHHRHTLLALSMDSGFNSKSTFNKSFKKVINDTPSNYIKKLNTI